MRAGLIGCMTTPKQGNVVPEGAWYACDNGKFGKGWPGADAWFGWLARKIARYGAERCLWATAPDVPFDAVGTLAESLPWLDRIRALGVPAAFCAQNGSEKPGMIPWDHIDVLFLAGGLECLPCGLIYDGPPPKPGQRLPCPSCGLRLTEWKLSSAAAELAAEATRRGLKVHMGRVSSETRLRHAIAIGCCTTDGTYLRFARNTNLPKLLRWTARLPKRQAPHVEFPLFEMTKEKVS
jgi:hypothetical protein